MAAPADHPPPAPPETSSPSPDHAPSCPSSSPQPPPTTEPAPETLAAPAVAAGPDCRSFSQLLAGAMASPTGTSRPVSPIFAVPVDAAGLPMVAVPCFLAPATLLDSPTFTGQFAMTHQAVLATVTAQAQMQLQVAQPVVSAISPVPLQQMPPSLQEESVCTPRVEKTQPQSVQIASKVNPDDGFNWRKYGQKQVKSSENSRSYYKCTSANCSAKKKVTRCPDGRVTEVMYRGEHSHDRPQQTRYWRERVVRSSPLGENEMLLPPSVESNDSDPSTSKTEQNSGNETPEQQLFCSSDCEGDAAVKTEEDLGEERDPKRRLSESTVLPYSSPVLKTFREPRIVVQAASDVGRVSDGYRWRKYGQKIVKGNPNPRSYYRCTHNGCPVRKHVERASDDVKSIVISYEGTHNHDLPGPKNSTDPPASPPLPSATASHSSHSKLDQKLSLPDEKALNIEGEKALESVQALLSIGCSPTASDGDKALESRNPNPPLRVENPAAVPVQNS